MFDSNRFNIKSKLSMSPQLHLSVLTSRSYQPSVYVPVQSIDLICVSRQVHHQLSCFYVPQLQRRILTRRYYESAVRRPAHDVDRTDVSIESAHKLTSIAVPKFDLFIERS